MDSSRIASAFRHYWWLLVAGVIIGAGLGVFTYVKTETVYSSDSVIFITQKGFPWGRTTISPETGRSDPSFAEASRFTELAVLYSQLADSDLVRQRVLEQGPIDGKVFPTVVFSANAQNAGALPLVRIRALANTPENAVDIATRWTAAFREYITSQQKRVGIPAEQLVLLEPVQTPKLREVEVALPRSVTRPVAILLAVLILVTGVTFLLDGARKKRLAADLLQQPGTTPLDDGTESLADELAAKKPRRHSIAG